MKKNLNIIGHRNIFFILSGLLVGASIILIIVFGFHYGVEFTGGVLWQFKINPAPSASDVQSFFKNNFNLDAVVNYDSANEDFLVRLPVLSETDHNLYLSKLKEAYPSFEEQSFESIGPSVSQQLKSNAILAILFVLIGISLYVAFAFRKVSKPVSSFKYGIITLLTLFHDVSVPAGFLALMGVLRNIEIDSNSIVALLVVMGFSVHDTIVVFDRIRENILIDHKNDFSTIINNSVNQTMARSINTSLALVLVLLSLFFFGPANLQYFNLTLLIGVVVGTYSSIFIASPLLLVWQKFSDKQRERKLKAARGK
jgi:preprotein translocase subunit SecF